MKKPLFLLAALAFASARPSLAQAPASAAQAQTAKPGKHHKTPEQSAAHHTAKLAKQLSLTADQQAKVHQIFLAQAQEAEATKAKYPAASQRPALKQAMQASKAKYQTQMQGVLSADQNGKLTAMKQEHHHKKGAHGGKAKAKS